MVKKTAIRALTGLARRDRMTPRNNRPAPKKPAVRTGSIPLGKGLSGLSMRSISRSKTSLRTTPPAYNITDAAIKESALRQVPAEIPSVPSGIMNKPAIAMPARISAIAVGKLAGLASLSNPRKAAFILADFIGIYPVLLASEDAIIME